MIMGGILELSQLVVCLGILSMAAALNVTVKDDDSQNAFEVLVEEAVAKAVRSRGPIEEEVEFRLFTRLHKDKGIVMKHDGKADSSSDFVPTKQIKFIVHGYSGGAHERWVIDIKNHYLDNNDFNIITLDWSKRVDMLSLERIINSNSSTFGRRNNEPVKLLRARIDKYSDQQREALARIMYPTSMEDVTALGNLMAKFIDNLVREFKVKGLDSMHLIGHSLGAHICGVAGSSVKNGKIGRITGLDPAHPHYHDMDETKRLDKTDALYVDVIHTDTIATGLGSVFDREFSHYGYRNPCGHADFYPNGGTDQPDCTASWSEWGTCYHSKANEYFLETIRNPRKFPAYKCRSLEEEIKNTKEHNGKCDKCCDKCPETKAYMGAAAVPSNRGLYYVYSDDNRKPQCIFKAEEGTEKPEQKKNKATFTHANIHPELVMFIVYLSSRTVLCH